MNIPDTLMKPADWKGFCERIISTHRARVMIAVLDSCEGNPHTQNTVKCASEMLEAEMQLLVISRTRGELSS